MGRGVSEGLLSAEEIAALSGLDYLRAMVAGRIAAPSMAGTLGFRLAEVEQGRAVFLGEPSDRVLNPMVIVHGGWALTLIDSACGCAGHTTLAPGRAYTTLETKTNFVRVITAESGTVRGEGKIVAAGRTIITAEARVTDEAGKLLAHGTSTLLVLSAR